MNVDTLGSSAKPCCSHKSRSPSRLPRRLASAAGWILPGAALVFMPKCPACFAAYVAAFTGLGITFTTATYFRSAAIVVSTLPILPMCLLLVSRVRHLRRT
jgi:hypothetical protein